MKPFNKKKCLQRLNITQEHWSPDVNQVPYDSHGYAIPETRTFAVNPLSAFPGAAGFHELAHIVLEHHLYFPNDLKYHEVEASAVTLICLEKLGLTRGMREVTEHYYNNLVKLKPEFLNRINHAAEMILKAGEDN